MFDCCKSTLIDQIRYPLGRFEAVQVVNDEILKVLIQELEDLPSRLKRTVTDLTEEQLDTPYREGGWTIRQVVHHIADTHINAYVRFKLGLTEEQPMVKTYDEVKWAELTDAKCASIDLSIVLIEVLHMRWVVLLNALQPESFKRKFIHPDSGDITLERVVEFYSWHGKHHMTQIENVLTNIRK